VLPDRQSLYPVYIEGVTESHIKDERRGDERR
jgi:hypothetical protein